MDNSVPYIGKYGRKVQEKRENMNSVDNLVSKYSIKNSNADKPPLYWTYIRKVTISQYIHVQVNTCIAKTLRTYAYTQPSLILMFPTFYIVTITYFKRQLTDNFKTANKYILTLILCQL